MSKELKWLLGSLTLMFIAMVWAIAWSGRAEPEEVQVISCEVHRDLYLETQGELKEMILLYNEALHRMLNDEAEMLGFEMDVAQSIASGVEVDYATACPEEAAFVMDQLAPSAEDFEQQEDL